MVKIGKCSACGHSIIIENIVDITDRITQYRRQSCKCGSNEMQLFVTEYMGNMNLTVVNASVPLNSRLRLPTHGIDRDGNIVPLDYDGAKLRWRAIDGEVVQYEIGKSDGKMGGRLIAELLWNSPRLAAELFGPEYHANNEMEPPPQRIKPTL